MTQEPQEQRDDRHEKLMNMLKPALERVATDSEFRNRLELHPLEALAEMNVVLDAETRAELEGKRFSEFWALRRKASEGPINDVRDLPPEDGQELNEEQLNKVAGGMNPLQRFEPQRVEPMQRIGRYAPPYVPV